MGDVEQGSAFGQRKIFGIRWTYLTLGLATKEPCHCGQLTLFAKSSLNFSVGLRHYQVLYGTIFLKLNFYNPGKADVKLCEYFRN